MSSGLTTIGPITAGTTGTPFMITSLDPAVLALGVNGVPAGYYCQVSLTLYGGITSSGTIGIFSVEGTGTSIVISDSANGGYIGIDGNNQLINSSTITHFELIQFWTPSQQSKYQEWNYPALMLGNVLYGITAPGEGPAQSYFIDIYGNIESAITDPNEVQFLALPVTWYYGVACDVVNSPTVSLEAWSCSVFNGTNTYGMSCPSTITETQSWTNLSDCVYGVQYTYCLAGSFCGTSNCNGPCENTGNSCEDTEGTYLCTPPSPPPGPTPPPSPTPTPSLPIWKSKIFIGSVVGVSFAVIILCIVLIVLHQREKT